MYTCSAIVGRKVACLSTGLEQPTFTSHGASTYYLFFPCKGYGGAGVGKKVSCPSKQYVGRVQNSIVYFPSCFFFLCIKRLW